MDRALLVGITDYFAKDAPPLLGCVNDAVDMAEFLVEKCGFSSSDIRLVTQRRATRAAIVERLDWLLDGVRSGDRIVFYFSGHGTQLPLRSPGGGGLQVYDTICPSDFDWTAATAITDADFQRLFGNVPAGVRFVWISDSCNSGGLNETFLKMVESTVPRYKQFPLPADIGWRLKTAEDLSVVAQGFKSVAGKLRNVLFLSACTRSQKAVDTEFDGRSNSAFTYHLLRKLREPAGSSTAAAKVVDALVRPLKKFKQTPEIQGPAPALGKPLLD